MTPEEAAATMPDWLVDEVREGLAEELRREYLAAIVTIHGCDPFQPGEATDEDEDEEWE